MVKITSILFSIVFLIQSINIHFEDIVKITELIDYANMHKERYGDSFDVFLSKHYGDLKESHKEQHEQEKQEQEQAPIEHDCKVQSQIVFLVNWNIYSFNSNQFIDYGKTKFHYQTKISTFEKQKIFQPPRIA